MKWKHKVRVVVVLIAVTLILSLVAPLSIVNAESVALLSGKVVKTGTNQKNPIGTTTLVTDNNTKTGFVVKADEKSNTINDFLIYDFSTPQTIDRYKLHIENAKDQSLYFAFHDSKETSLTVISIVPGDDGIYELPARVKNVSKVFIWNNNKYDIKVLEWELYNDSVPATPLNLTASPNNTQIELTWNPISDESSYVLYRSLTPGGPYISIATMSTSKYSDLNVAKGITYYYVVEAVNNAGNSGSSNEDSAILLEVEQPEEGRAILVITMVTGLEKEYDLSMAEVNDFIKWYEAKQAGIGSALFAIDRHDNNRGPFKNRKDYVVYDKILMFEVNHY